MSKPITELEVIKLSKVVIVKYHISLNCTAIMTIENGSASLEIKHYGPDKDKIPAFVPTGNSTEVQKTQSKELMRIYDPKLKMGQLWIVRVPGRERLLEGTISRLTKKVVAFDTLDDPPKFHGPYMIKQVHFMSRP